MPARNLGARYTGYKWCRPSTRWAIYWRDRDPETDELRCLWCGRSASVTDVYAGRLRLSLDHLDPWSAGGGNEATNLVTACLTCNARRQDETYEETCVTGKFEDAAYDRVRHAVALPLDRSKGRALARAAPRRPWRKPQAVTERDPKIVWTAPTAEELEAWPPVDWEGMFG